MATEEKTKTKSEKLPETQTKKNEEFKLSTEAKKREEFKLLTPQAVLDRGKQSKKKAKAAFKKRIVGDCKNYLSHADAIPVLFSISMSEENYVPESPQIVLNIFKKEFLSIPWEISIKAVGATRERVYHITFDYSRNTNTDTK